MKHLYYPFDMDDMTNLLYLYIIIISPLFVGVLDCHVVRNRRCYYDSCSVSKMWIISQSWALLITAGFPSFQSIFQWCNARESYATMLCTFYWYFLLNYIVAAKICNFFFQICTKIKCVPQNVTHFENAFEYKIVLVIFSLWAKCDLVSKIISTGSIWAWNKLKSQNEFSFQPLKNVMCNISFHSYLLFLFK